jgi:hypothetical protein
MPIPPDTLTTALIPRILTPTTSVAELLALFQQQPQPSACYAVVRLAADAYDLLALTDLSDATQQHGQSLLQMPLGAVPSLLQPAAPVRQATTGQAAAERKLHASPRRRLVVLDAHGDVPGILVSHSLSVPKGADPLALLTPAVLGEEAPTLPPHLNTRFEGLAPDQPLPVGQRVPFVVWVGLPTGQRSEPFQFTFPNDDTPVTFTVQLHAVPDTWTVKVIEPTMIVAPPGTTTQEAEFLVTAKQPGRDTLFVTVAHAETDATVQHLCLPVYAAQEVAPASPPPAREPIEVSFPLEDTSLKRQTVEIALCPGADGEGFDAVVRADLANHTIWETYRVPVSTDEIQNAALRLRQELERIVFYPGKESGGPFPFASLDTLTIDETLARETAVALADAGQQFWCLLFEAPRAPAALKQFAADLRELAHGSSVQIVLYSQRFIIPWFLLYDKPGPITADTLDWTGFWGYRFRLGGIPPGRYPTPIINDQPPGLLALFNDEANLRSFTTAQEQAIRTVLNQETWHGIWGDAAVRESLRIPEAIALVYCYCHGTHTSGAVKAATLASESALSFSTGAQVRLADLRRLPATYFARRPLVFLNACEGGTQDAFYYDGFMPYFIEELGARGFIGTEVKAPQLLAHDIALHFLEAFAAGQPVGDILWRLRRHYLDTHHNILAFNYSLYCRGDVRVILRHDFLDTYLHAGGE